MAWELALAVDVAMPVRYTAQVDCFGPALAPSQAGLSQSLREKVRPADAIMQDQSQTLQCRQCKATSTSTNAAVLQQKQQHGQWLNMALCSIESILLAPLARATATAFALPELISPRTCNHNSDS